MKYIYSGNNSHVIKLVIIRNYVREHQEPFQREYLNSYSRYLLAESYLHVGFILFLYCLRMNFETHTSDWIYSFLYCLHMNFFGVFYN